MSSTSGEDAGSRQKWGLDRQSLEALLAMLGGRTDTGAEQYERIRAKLIRFFTWERCPFPEEHTDEVLNRVARRVGEGEEILNPDSYFYGVARMVVKEVQQRSLREERSMEELRRRTADEPPAEAQEDAASCLQECLESFPIAWVRLLQLTKSFRQVRERRSKLLAVGLNRFLNNQLVECPL